MPRRGRGRARFFPAGLSRLHNLMQFRNADLNSGTKQSTDTDSNLGDSLDHDIGGNISPIHEAELRVNNYIDADDTNMERQASREKDLYSRIESHSSVQSLNNSDESRRSSADSSMALTASGLSRLGKRKRRIENDDSLIESNYSLRRRRGSRMITDSVNGTHDAENPQQDSMSLPGVEIEDAQDTSNIATELLDVEVDGDAVPNSLAPVVSKRRGRRPYRFRAETPADSTMETPIPGTPLNGNDIGTGGGTDQERTKMVRRLPGRRRAPNANPSIEADLRRQLTLKMSYRSVVKALKPVLAELTRRSIEQLENDDDAHRKCEEYDRVMDQLNVYLKRRVDQVDSQLLYGQLLNDNELRDGREYYQMQFEAQVENLREEYLSKILAQLLELRRQAEQDDEDLTEDEDGVIPPLRPAASHMKEERILDPKYDSRSRFYLELDRLSRYHESRLNATSILESQMDTIRPSIDQELMDMESGLGQFDKSRRDQSIMQFNIHALANAAEEIETEELRTRKAISEAEPLASGGFNALLEAIQYTEYGFHPPEAGEDVKPQLHTLTNSIYTVPQISSQSNLSPQYLKHITKKEEVSDSSVLTFGIQPTAPPDGTGHITSYTSQPPDSIRDGSRGGENRVQRRMNLSDMLSSDPRSPIKDGYQGFDRNTQRTHPMSSHTGASNDAWAASERNLGSLPGIKAFRNPFGTPQSTQTVPMFERSIDSPIRGVQDRFPDQSGFERPSMPNLYDARPPEAAPILNEPPRNRARASTLPTTQGSHQQGVHYQTSPAEGSNILYTGTRLEAQSQPLAGLDEMSRPPAMSSILPNVLPPGAERGPEFERRVTISGPEALHHPPFPNSSVHPPTQPQRGQFYTSQAENLPPPGYPYPAVPNEARYQAYVAPPASGQSQWQPHQSTQMSPQYSYHNAPPAPPDGYPTPPQQQFYGPRIAPAPPPSWHSSPGTQPALHHHHHAPPQPLQDSEPPRPPQTPPTATQQHNAQAPASNDYRRHSDATIDSGAPATIYELPRLAPAFEHKKGSSTTQEEDPQDNGVRAGSENMDMEPSPNHRPESAPPYSYGDEDEDEQGEIKHDRKLKKAVEHTEKRELPPS